MHLPIRTGAICACCFLLLAQCANEEKGPTGSDIEQTDALRNDMGSEDRSSADTMEDLKDYPGDSV